jgi:GT2 family glycosyltransferase
MKHIDIFMLTWDHFSQSAKSIRSLLEITSCPDYTLIVNDNGSSREMQSYLQDIRRDRRVRLIQHKTPEVSFCQAMNECLKESNSELIVTVQNDMIFKNANWLIELVNCLERNPDAGMAGAKLIYPNGTIQHAGATFSEQGEWYHLGRGMPSNEFNEEREVPGCTSAVMIVRRAAIPGGGWNEDYLGAANHNDVEMCCLMRKNGWKIMYCPASEVIHLESLTASENLTSPIIDFNIETFKRNCWNWLMDDMRLRPEFYMETIKLTESLAVIYQSGWHLFEIWNGMPSRWMLADSSIVILSSEECTVDLKMSVMSFRRPRTLEISSSNGSAIRFCVPTSSFITASVPLCLGKGSQVVHFHVPEGCERPCDVEALNNPDNRCLSVAIHSLKLTERKPGQLVYLYGFYDIENWSCTPARWMQSDAAIAVFSSKDSIALLSLRALSFYRNRTLEIFSERTLEARVDLPTTFIKMNMSIYLKKGANKLRLHVPEGCERPSDKKELNSSDKRCLSIALQDLTVII